MGVLTLTLMMVMVKISEQVTVIDASLANNCYEVMQAGHSADGVYRITLNGQATELYCELEDGVAWTVILRRQDTEDDHGHHGHGEDEDDDDEDGHVHENFNRSSSEYKQKFGDFDCEFFIGLDTLHNLTNAPGDNYKLRIEMESFDGGDGYAEYNLFSVGDSTTGYVATVGGYIPGGTAGDGLSSANGMQFSTYDNDVDISSSHCALTLGGGWWYRNCGGANPTGIYYEYNNYSPYLNGITYASFRGPLESLEFLEIKIKLL